jgi:SSU ribosomal protein S21P
MSEVKIGKNESLDSALRRFKRQLQRAGVLAEISEARALREAECEAQEEERGRS